MFDDSERHGGSFQIVAAANHVCVDTYLHSHSLASKLASE